MTIEEKSLRQSSQKLGHSSLRIQTLVMWKAGEARAGTQDTSTWSGNSHSAGESIKLLGPINYACRLTLNLIFKLLPPSPPPPAPCPSLSILMLFPSPDSSVQTADLSFSLALHIDHGYLWKNNPFFFLFFFEVLPPFIPMPFSSSIIYCVFMCQSHCWYQFILPSKW